MKSTLVLLACTALIAVGCCKSDSRSTTPDNVIDRAVNDVQSSVEESPDRVEQAAGDVADSVEESPDRIRQTGDDVGETMDDVTGRE